MEILENFNYEMNLDLDAILNDISESVSTESQED